jgi:hypothetical protein
LEAFASPGSVASAGIAGAVFRVAGVALGHFVMFDAAAFMMDAI